MRSITTKRVFGAVLTAGLAASAVVGLAGNSEAATPAASILPVSGSAAGGDTLSVKGKGFMNTDGDVLVKAVTFSSTVCGATVAGTAVTSGNYNIVSATKATLTTPVLAAGTWYLCMWDAASGASAPLGQAKFVTGAAPTVTSVNGLSAASSVISASTFGGSTLTVVGTNISKKSVVYVGATKAATKYVSTTKLTATVPAGSAATGKAIKVTSEYGSGTNANVTLTYQKVIKIAPAFGKVNAATGIDITGRDFNDYKFGTAVGEYSIAFVDATVDTSAGQTVPTTGLCSNVVVEKDTLLSCKSPALAGGAYSVVLIERDATTNTDIGSSTALSRNATFTAADF